MAALSCPVCGAEVRYGDLICSDCGSNLARPQAGMPARPQAGMPARPPGAGPSPGGPSPGGPVPPTAARPVPPPAGTAGPPGAAMSCPHCGAPVPDPATMVCLACLRPIRAEPTGIRLVFATWEADIPLGTSLLVGRDLSSPAAAALAPHDNVSRRHVTISVNPAGQASVRDEQSTNGTFVNDQRIPPGQPVPLRDGDVLRLAGDVTGTVYRLPPR